MSGQTKHKQTMRLTAPELTAQPREHSEEISIDPEDLYASLAPEDLGEHALRAATQSGYPGADSDAPGIASIAMAGAPLRGEVFEDVSEDELWAETLELALEYGGVWVGEISESDQVEWDGGGEATWSRDVDLHQAKVVEASLFDPGSQETVDETRRPRVFADDDSPEHTQIVRRGKHARARTGRGAVAS